MDDRIKVLAHNLVNYSMNVQNGEKVFVHYTGPTTEPLARQIIKEVYKVGGIPFPEYTNPSSRECFNCTKSKWNAG